MTAKSKLDGREIYWCKDNYDWRYADTKEPVKKIYQLQYHCPGEGIDFVVTLTKEQQDLIDNMTGGDSIQDIDPDNPMMIKMVSPRQERESRISGLIFGDGLSRENAERVADGKEMIDEDE